MRLDTLLERLEYKVVQGSAETEVTTLINDSRKVENGSVFVCISSAEIDLSQILDKYAAEVAEKGAAAVVVEKDVEVPADVTVIKVEDTRYALALMSAAYFGYPAEKLKTSIPLAVHWSIWSLVPLGRPIPADSNSSKIFIDSFKSIITRSYTSSTVESPNVSAVV